MAFLSTEFVVDFIQQAQLVLCWHTIVKNLDSALVRTQSLVGIPVCELCSHAYMNPNLKYNMIDLCDSWSPQAKDGFTMQQGRRDLRCNMLLDTCSFCTYFDVLSSNTEITCCSYRYGAETELEYACIQHWKKIVWGDAGCNSWLLHHFLRWLHFCQSLDMVVMINKLYAGKLSSWWLVLQSF